MTFKRSDIAALTGTPIPDAASRVFDVLSAREIDVLARIGRGDSMAKIGRDLRITHSTVSTHRRRMLVKMEMRSTRDLILLALAAGIQ